MTVAPVYLDHAAGGPLSAASAAAMEPWMSGWFGNPSGTHAVARRARAAVDDARDAVADLVGAAPGDVVFTSGGTEADNLGVLGPLAGRPGAVVVSAVEHPAVMEAARASGREVRLVGVDPDGIVDFESLRRVLDADVAVVSLQLANHETGVVQPLAPVAARVRRWARGAVLHTDAVQAAGWLDLGEHTAPADLISISGHKFGGPQGSGALVARGVGLAPVLHGGGQERERRSGTHNVAAIVGLGAACSAVVGGREGRAAVVAARRDALAARIAAGVPDAVTTADRSPRLPGHLHLRVPGVESEDLLVLLDRAGVCASAGAACASGALDPSPVLLAMGVTKDEARTSLRLSLGPTTGDSDVGRAAAAVVAAVAELRAGGEGAWR